MRLIKPFRVFAALAGGLLFCASCSNESEPAVLPPDALAVVGSRIITQQDLMHEAQQRQESGLTALAPDVLLERMVTRASLVEKARQLGLEQEPDVQLEIERVLATRLRERELPALLENLSVSESELRRIYQEKLSDFTTPALHRIAWLYLKRDKNASAAKQSELLARMKDAQEAAVKFAVDASGFGELAVSHSDDVTSRYRGGDLGWIRADQPPAHIPESVFALTLELPVGQLSGIIETGQGLFLTIRTDERSAVVKPFEEVRTALEKRWLNEARATTEKAYYESCHAAVHIQMIEKNVERLSTQVGPTASAGLRKSHPQTNF